MDFSRVINQAIARTVNKCYAEEDGITLPQSNWSFTPLIPPGCVPFLELYGLENGKRPSLKNRGKKMVFQWSIRSWPKWLREQTGKM